jgi:ribulose-5-phosphate 4-epimerase/fuculose-1-phosphate aldolase
MENADVSYCPISRNTHNQPHFLNMDASTEDAVLQSLFRKFIDGSHILHYHNVLDAFGHLSFRHPSQPGVFFMSHSIAPGSITSPQDLIAYHVEDAEPVNASASKGYAERRIHSEIYKRHPHVHAAVHSHSEAVVPYSIAGVPLRACYHMAAFIGASGAPVFDIGDHYHVDDVPDMLVRSEHTGAALAKCFDDGEAVALMRGHGFTAVAETLELAVLRAIYTQKNATIQTSAVMLKFASCASSQQIKYLNQRECEAADATTKWAAGRPWELWVREVSNSGLYSNSA